MTSVLFWFLMIRIPPRDAEDAALLKRIAGGEEAALGDLYDRYGRILYAFTMKMLRSVEDSQDIIQDVFLRVWNRAETYDAAKGSVYAWLVGMTRNRTIDKVRSKGYKKQGQTVDIASLVAESDEPNPHVKTVAEEYRQLVAGALRSLEADQQKVISLAYFDGYSQSEIAETLRIPLGTVKSRMRKALLVMRSRLDGKVE